LQDWEELLEANVLAGYSSSNTGHLHWLRTISCNFQEIFQLQAGLHIKTRIYHGIYPTHPQLFLTAFCAERM
jgi:hypothetical protein